MEGATFVARSRAGALPWSRARLSAGHLLVGLVALAVGIRLLGLDARPLWLDEGYTAWFSSRSWHDLWTVVPTYEPHPPFYYSLLKLWRGLWGDGLVAMRSLSVLLGVLTVPVIFYAALEHDRQEPGGRPLLRASLAGLLAACAPILTWHGQEARPYPLLVFGYALAILSLLRLMRDFRAGGAGSWAAWAALGVGTELTLWSHSLGILYGFCLFVALCASAAAPAHNRARWTVLAAVTAVVGLAYVPCLLMVVERTGDWSAGWLTFKPMMTLQLLGLYSVPLEALTVVSFGAVLIMLVMAKRALSFAAGQAGWTTSRALVLLWLGPPVLAILISATLAPVFLIRTLVPTVVPAYLMIAAAVARIDSRERVLAVALLFGSITVTAAQMSTRKPAEKWDEVGAYLAEQVKPGDEVWLYPNDSVLPLADVARRRGHDYPVRSVPAAFPALGVEGPVRAGSPAVVSVTRAQAERIVRDPAAAKVRTVWLVTRQSKLFDPDGDFTYALAGVRRPGPWREWGYIKVQAFTRTGER